MLKEAMQQYAGTLEKTWENDRRLTVGASEIGLCARRVHWAKKEGNVDLDHEEKWGARMRGNMIEAHLWVPALQKKFGKKLMWCGDKQRTFKKGELSATPDGLLVGPPADILRHLGVRDLTGDSLVVECKSVDPRVNLTKAKEENAFQVQVQMGLIRELTNYKPEWAWISYIDASFWDELDEFAVRFDQAIYDGAKVRATKILRAEHAKELKPEGWIAGGKECEYCPYTKVCGIIRRSLPERDLAADPQFAAEIQDACAEYLALQEEQDKAEARVREKQQEIKDRLRDRGVRRVPGVVVWSPVKGRESWDNRKIREEAEAAGVDVLQHRTIGDPTDRLEVSLVLRESSPPTGRRKRKRR
jgi:predicted ATP-grasp superfamily ATP-dependent carboligase